MRGRAPRRPEAALTRIDDDNNTTRHARTGSPSASSRLPRIECGVYRRAFTGTREHAPGDACFSFPALERHLRHTDPGPRRGGEEGLDVVQRLSLGRLG